MGIQLCRAWDGGNGGGEVNVGRSFDTWTTPDGYALCLLIQSLHVASRQLGRLCATARETEHVDRRDALDCIPVTDYEGLQLNTTNGSSQKEAW